MNTPYVLFLTLLTASGIVPPLSAQIVNDGATNTLSNVTTNITGTVTVGTNGAFTLLVLSDNALLTNSAHGVVGFNVNARSNEVHLASPSARWLMGGNLFVGSNGAMNRLVVSNGAFLENNNGILGNRIDSSNNLALVTGAGSVWSNRNDITVGTLGRNNQMIVSNGGWVASQNTRLGGNVSGSNNLMIVTGSSSVWSNASTVFVGNAAPGKMVIEAGGLVHDDTGTIGGFTSASNSEALVTGPGSRWNNASFLTIGNNVGRNRLVVSNGAAVWSGSGVMGGVSAASSNQVVVTGAGSVWSNQTFLNLGSTANRVDVSEGGWLACNDGSFVGSSNTVVLTGGGSGWNNLGGLIVGSAGSANMLIASNGATVLSSNATIGVNGGTANNNLALVTGAGTLWSNRHDLTVGSFGVGNRLQVDNGATVLSGNLFVGFNSLSADNRVTVNGGTLRVTNALGTGVLDVRRGTNVLNSGLIEVDQLLVANSAGRFEFNGGTLAVGQSTVANGLSFDAGDGTSPATLNLTGNGTHSFSGNLVVRSNATLMGNGALLAPVISARTGSTISPGAAPGAIGRLSSSGAVNLRGIVRMEISKSGAVLTNDQFQAASISYLGSLVIAIKIGPDALTAGDRFQLFPAGSYDVGGANVLPGLAPGLRWVNNLRVDGSIEVESLAPFVQTLPPSALTPTSATFNGVANPKGTSTTAWFEFGFSTNYGFVTAPQALGSADANTSFSESVTGLIPGFGYHIRAVASNIFGVGFGGEQRLIAPPRPDYLKTDDTSAFSGLGRLVAISGDTVVAVAGNGGYVFVREGSSWEQQAHFTDFQNISSVAISGDTLVIGDTGDDNDSPTNTNSGAAHVFVRSGTTWTRQDILRKSNPRPFEEFGTSVGISGDTIVVGVPLETHSLVQIIDPLNPGFPTFGPAVHAGTAYVFVRSGTNWTQQALLRSDNIVSGGGLLGISVAIAGDTIVAGEPHGAVPVVINGVSSFVLGAGHVFVRSGTNWSHQATLLRSNPDSGVDEGLVIPFDEFGASVAISDDTLVVGAPREDSNATGVNGSDANNLAVNSGAAYVYERSGTNWTQQAYLKASNTGSNDFFGASVAMSGDLIVIGAVGEDGNARNVNGDGANDLAPDSGAAYLFARQGGIWSFRDYLKASNTESNDAFGVSVAVSGNLIVVGANGEDSNALGFNGDQDDNSATNSGAVYIFGPPRLPTPEITVSHSGTNLRTGASLPQLIAAVGHPATRSVTIKNTGNDFLTGLVITFVGPDAAMFSVAVPPVAPLTPTSNTTFIVRFVPTSGGTKTATLRIASNDENENPFDLQLNDLSLSFAEDQDGDGLNDASELLMAPLGFNFQATQTSLVNTLFNNANGAGLFTQTQIQALNVDTPLLAHDPLTGFFKLTIGVQKATDLTNFLAFPMTVPQTTINAEGKLEFQFTAPANAAFFRLEAR